MRRLPLYHPVQLAEQAALLDQLSGGHFDFGGGKGGFPRARAVRPYHLHRPGGGVRHYARRGAASLL